MRIFQALALLEGLKTHETIEKYKSTRDNKIVEGWANDLEVKYEIVDSTIRASNASFPIEEGSPAFHFRLSLTNTGKNSIINDFDWSIYFYQDQSILRDEDTPLYVPTSIGQGLTIQHVNGYLWRLSPNDDWENLGPSESREWNLYGDGWIVQDSTLFPNWYIACKDPEVCGASVIKSTVDMTFNRPDYVTPFTRSVQVKRDIDDQWDVRTVGEIYDENEMFKIYEKDGRSKKIYGLPILPSPHKVQMNPNNNQIDDNGNVKLEGSIPINKNAWQFSWQEQTTVNCENPVCFPNADGSYQCPEVEKFQSGKSCETDPIIGCRQMQFQIGFTSDFWKITADSGININAADCEGAWAATRFLEKLAKKLDRDPEAIFFKGDIIGSQPRYGTRSLFLDMARNFHGAQTVFKLLDIMAMLEFNQLHLRLSDDEGWRIEIEDLPELTTIGSNRCHDLSGENCIMPQLGSGPDKESPGSGYFSKAEYIDILMFGRDNGINIVPEIVGPGHNYAAIHAMEKRFENTQDATYRLIDPEADPSLEASVQAFYNDTMCPCVEGTRNFLEKILDVFVEMHQSFWKDGFHTHFHIGGDETNLNQLANGPACQKYMSENKLEPDQLLHDFFKWYVKITAEKGFHVDGWEEVWEYEDPENPGFYKIYNPEEWDVDLDNVTLTGYHWNNMWLEDDAPTTGYLMANAGYKVILAPATHFYLDHAQYPDENERGLMWATRFSSFWKAFSFRPEDMYRSALYGYWGNKIQEGCDNSAKEFQCAPLQKPENIQGLSACLWTEEIIDEKFLWTQFFPRALAVAERAYKKADWEESDRYSDSWDIFSDERNRLNKNYQNLMNPIFEIFTKLILETLNNLADTSQISIISDMHPNFSCAIWRHSTKYRTICLNRAQK